MLLDEGGYTVLQRLQAGHPVVVEKVVKILELLNSGPHYRRSTFFAEDTLT